MAYRAVPRQLNVQADDMCRRALEAEGPVEFWDGQLPQGAPPLEVEQLYAAVSSSAEAPAQVFAILCAAAHEARNAAEGPQGDEDEEEQQQPDP